ncbi:MAG: exonuclease SbcCD subunit D [Oscillospiraceae bacterium]
MRFLHLADLHIGKKLYEYSLLDDQKRVLEQALQVVQDCHCDEVIIAGDVYDKPNPSVEAMQVFSGFLASLSNMGIPVDIISGNHDSAGRISYFSELLKYHHITVTTEFNGKLQAVKSPEEDIQIYLLPFLTPQRVRSVYQGIPFTTYEEALKIVLDHSPIDKSKVNILVAHQFITGGITSESEEFSVGGLDNINAEIFADFDYVALGHLHAPQSCGRKTVRYSGSPLKYSVSEEHQKKSFTIVEVKGKEDIQIEEIPIQLPHDVRTVQGSFDELMKANRTEDYVRILLTDETIIPDARISLRSNFPKLLNIRLNNTKIKKDWDIPVVEMPQNQTPLELFREFFMMQNNHALPTAEQLALAKEIFEELQEELP